MSKQKGACASSYLELRWVHLAADELIEGGLAPPLPAQAPERVRFLDRRSAPRAANLLQKRRGRKITRLRMEGESRSRETQFDKSKHKTTTHSIQ